MSGARASRAFDWTEERMAECRRLYIDLGQSASETGKVLGTSKNSVIGKAHRMGWQRSPEVRQQNHERNGRNHSGFARPRAAPRPKPAPKPVRVKPSTPMEPVMQIDEPYGRPWITRINHVECAWPVGGIGADTRSCCAPTGGKTYCARHLQIRHQQGHGSWASATELTRSLRRHLA